MKPRSHRTHRTGNDVDLCFDVIKPIAGRTTHFRWVIQPKWRRRDAERNCTVDAIIVGAEPAGLAVGACLRRAQILFCLSQRRTI